MANILLVGLGGTGSWVLELLLRRPEIRNIVACDATDRQKMIVTALNGANHFGFYPNVTFEKIDLMDVSRTAEMITAANPDVVINCTSPMPWYDRSRLQVPSDIAQGLKAASAGAWLPVNLFLVYPLMRAVQMSEVNTKVINLTFPDAVNAILHRKGLAPTVGAGNFDQYIPTIVREVAKCTGTHPRNIQVTLIAHHAHLALLRDSGDKIEESPYYLRVLCNGEDITSDLPKNEIVRKAAEERLPGVFQNSLVASSLVKNALAIITDSHLLTYAPGPKGLVGGYPVEISSNDIKVVLPPNMSMDEALAINQKVQRYDGIEAILDDGTVVLTDKAYQGMKQATGHDMKRFSLDESSELAGMLMKVFNNLKSTYGLKPYSDII